MAYVTGIATSGADLSTAIYNAVVAAGWTAETSNIVSKGGAYFQIQPVSTTVRVDAGLGVSGSALTNSSGVSARFRIAVSAEGSPSISYPLTYHIHINTNPDDVVVFINHQTVYWQWLLFGKMTVFEGDGTGTYVSACGFDPALASTIQNFAMPMYPSYGNTQTFVTPFIQSYSGYGEVNSISHKINLYGASWVSPVIGDVNGISKTYQALVGTRTFLMNQPNAWNGEIVLKRNIIKEIRPGRLISSVAELPHIRLCRNDNYDDGGEFLIGGDTWKIYPAVRKNSAARNGNYDGTHTGTIAIAVRKVV